MSTIVRIAKNTSIIIAGNVIFRLISLFVTIYLAKYLGTIDFGKYSFVFAYLAFFGVISDLGLQQVLVREMSRDPSKTQKLIGNAFIIRLILTIFAVVLSLIIITLMSYPKDTTSYIYMASFTVFFISFSNFYATLFHTNLKMEYDIISKLTFKVLSAGLIFLIIFSHGTLMQVIIVLVFSEMVKSVMNYLFSRKFVRQRFEVDLRLWKHLFEVALPIALYSIIHTIYFRIDVVMLSMMIGDASVGIYSAAYSLSEPLALISLAFLASLFPIMSASFKSSEERLIKTYRLSIRYLFIITLPIAIGTAIIADKIIFLIYGAEFADSATALQILIWALVFTSWNFILINLLIAIDKQKLNTVSIALCAAVNVTLNFFLIPILSYNGAAIATVMTNILLFVVCFYFVCKHLQVLPLHKITVKPVISGLVMGAFVYYFIDINIFLLVLLAAVVYLIALLALKTFTEEDLAIVKKIVSNIPWIRRLN